MEATATGARTAAPVEARAALAPATGARQVTKFVMDTVAIVKTCVRRLWDVDAPAFVSEPNPPPRPDGDQRISRSPNGRCQLKCQSLIGPFLSCVRFRLKVPRAKNPTRTRSASNLVRVPSARLEATAALVSMEEFTGPYPRPFARDFEAWSRAVTPARIAELRRDGFTVVDDFLGGGGADGADGADASSSSGNGDAWALALREEIEWLSAKDGVMRPNRTHFANPKGERFLFAKPGIVEADMHDESVAAVVPELRAFFEAAATKFADAFDPKTEDASVSERDGGGAKEDFTYTYALSRGHGARTVKVQRNDGTGGCFPTHYDNPGPPSKRALTCILYLNPHWRTGDGGELDLVPFCATPTRVAPRLGRLVAFLSDRVLHRVQPARATRHCLTVWVDGPDVNSPKECGLSLPPSAMGDVPGTARALRASASQRVISRWCYPDEYEASLRECMRDAEGGEQMVESHLAHVAKLRDNPPLRKLVDALREHRRDVEGKLTVVG